MLFGAVASALLIGPSAYHPLRFRPHHVEHTVEMGQVALTIAAGVVVACSMIVTHEVAVVLGTGNLALLGGLWLVLRSPAARGIGADAHR